MLKKFKTIAVQALLGQLACIAFDPIDRKIYAYGPKMFVINADDLDIKFGDIEFEWEVPDAPRTFTLDIEDRKIYWVLWRTAYRMNS